MWLVPVLVVIYSEELTNAMGFLGMRSIQQWRHYVKAVVCRHVLPAVDSAVLVEVIEGRPRVKLPPEGYPIGPSRTCRNAVLGVNTNW
jgi:hypothetical protein